MAQHGTRVVDSEYGNGNHSNARRRQNGTRVVVTEHGTVRCPRSSYGTRYSTVPAYRQIAKSAISRATRGVFVTKYS